MIRDVKTTTITTITLTDEDIRTAIVYFLKMADIKLDKKSVYIEIDRDNDRGHIYSMKVEIKT